ncbi:MAG: PIN domain-containing protein [Thermoplasmata archaeon]
MKFVVDTNVLISALLKNSVSRMLIIELNEDFYSPDFLEIEIEKHKGTILEKSGLSEVELNNILTLLLDKILVAPEETYRTELEQATEILGDTDIKDVPFLALAIKKDAYIWSDDGDFEEQDLVEVWKTKKMVEHFFK